MYETPTQPMADPADRYPASAAEYMAALNGEIINEQFAAGWAQQDKHHSGEDTVYAFADQGIAGNGVFAVFDGCGGSHDGKASAEAATEWLHDFAVNNEGVVIAEGLSTLEGLFDGLNKASQARTSYGYSVGIVGLLQKDIISGESIMHWGAVGDALGFVIQSNGQVYQINREETARQDMLDDGIEEEKADRLGYVITNGLGADAYQHGLRQKGYLRLSAGDKVLFASDGITGDTADQRLRGGPDNESVISAIVNRIDLTPQQKAQALIEAATKFDDRTALIIEVK